MKLQHKAWLLILAAVGIVTLLAIVVTGQTISRSFAALEDERALHEGERARRILSQQAQELLTTTIDYAYWDDAVRFVRGQDDAFLDDNITEDNMKYLRVSEVLVLDGTGQPKAAARLVDGEELQLVSSGLLPKLLQLGQPLLADASGTSTLRTFVQHEQQLYVVAAAAIRDPGVVVQPSSGVLLMVRTISHAELVRLSDLMLTQVSLSFDGIAKAGVKVWTRELSDRRIGVQAVIDDHDGQPVATLDLNLAREMDEEARSLAVTTGLQVLLSGLIVGAALVFLLDRWVLRRLSRMHDQLGAITAEGLAGSERIRMGGQDELTTVANGINSLLDRVRMDAIEQKNAHARQEALQLQLMQSQKMEALGRFTGGIAHDFNNSLAGISGWMRLAQEDLAADHPSREAVDQAIKGAQYAQGLMRQLLTFSRQSKLNLEPVHVGALVEQTRKFVSSGLVRSTQVQVEQLCEDDLIQADPTQLQQVLVNLIINASDAMDGVGRVRLRVDRLSLPLPAGQASWPGVAELPAGDYLHVQVCDDGPGIAPENIDRIFDPFFTTKSVGKGTGLGLSVAHGVMGRHGGSIGVVSQPGHGACFHLLLPAQARPDASGQTSLGTSGASSGTLRMLFADDDQLVRHSWGSLLERQGWDVIRARDGEEAWQLYQGSGQRWDVVLTDLTMPKLDGRSLMQRIRQTPDAPPVVLVSGHVGDAQRQALLDDGFAEVLFKPVSFDDLGQILRQVAAKGRPAD
ncbi:ATP-binding protein [Hydrogenophaga sp.]|uniref:ATP-binding protein n=1 Tax=Hydrogenophaga sp. TaxID=1904254 RepID=UPI0035B09418